MTIDNLSTISKLDRDNMLDLLVSFPRQCEDALFIGEHSHVKASYKKHYSNIIFLGLGGSAIGADILSGYVGRELDIPIIVSRDYNLPAFATASSLIFAVSYSGNTEETLSAYDEARKLGANIVAITSGGRLKEEAFKHKDTIAIIPKGYPPRCALGYSFIPAVSILSRLGMIKDKKDEIKKAASHLARLCERKVGPTVSGTNNISKVIANKMLGRYPVIYGSNALSSVVTRWRGQLAENSKVLASSHVLPEMNHNEIVGWEHPRAILKKFIALILKDKDDHPRIKRRMDITHSILKREGFKVLELESIGTSLLERMLSLIYIGDFTSFYLSILNRTDPTPVDRITYLKKQLAK